MYITLGDAVLELGYPIYINETERDISLFSPIIRQASIYEGHNETEVDAATPNLAYSFFSGTYKASDTDKPFNRRPVYYQDGMKGDWTAGMFYYCENEQAWVFTIPTMRDNIPDESRKVCEHGWLM